MQKSWWVVEPFCHRARDARVKDPDKSFHLRESLMLSSLLAFALFSERKKKKRVDIPGFLSMARGSSLNILLLLYFSINDVCCVLSCFDVEKRLRSVCRWFSVSSPSPLHFSPLIEIHASRVSSRWQLLSLLFFHFIMSRGKNSKVMKLNSPAIHSKWRVVASPFFFFIFISRCEYVCVSLHDFYQMPFFFLLFVCMPLLLSLVLVFSFDVTVVLSFFQSAAKKKNEFELHDLQGQTTPKFR